ncbi:hypothetical protein BH24ACT5_BH24ACT5_19220 [soil metagenome]
MTTDLDFDFDAMFRDVAQALVAGAPEIPEFERRAAAMAPPRRWVPLSAAAAVVALGIGGLAVTRVGNGVDPSSTASDTQPDGVAADEVVSPTLYPVIDDLADHAAAEWLPDELLAYYTGANATALIGEMGDDGTILSTLQLRAGVRLGQNLEWRFGQLVDTTTVFGVAGSVYENSELGGPAGTRTVLWGTPPYFHTDAGLPYFVLTGQPAIAGADPVEFLQAASPEFATFTVTDEAGPVDMTIGDLPLGFELLAGPQSLGGASGSRSAILRLAPTGSFVQTSMFDPLVEYGNVGPLQRVDINGHDGWVNDTGSVVVWQVDESTWARAVALRAGDGVGLAESVRFVDQATWTNLYQPQPAPTGPQFTPITGPVEYPDQVGPADWGTVPASTR